ncbi:MAG: MotE family protein [Rickettsiaceae bacterium]
MKINLFSPILIILILTLCVKASVLFGRVQEQTIYSMDTNTSSVLINTAYAGNSNSSNKSTDAIKSSPIITSEEKTNPILEKLTLDAKSNKQLDINNLSRSELNLLKELSARRNTIEQDKSSLNTREKILKATEVKLDQKVVELKTLQNQLEVLMQQYEQKENQKIMSLVKIYENMKPKDAAKIFNELEMPVLLKVVSNMKEIRVAPVIASMEPSKARELSIELAKEKPIE